MYSDFENVGFGRQYYRVLSAALLHGGLMHIAFNMMSFLSIGANLVSNRWSDGAL